MFAVIYKFKVKEGKEEQFESSWRRMTELIMDYKGGLGSRLHKTTELNYIAYAQWPNKSMWQADVKMSEEVKEVGRLMKDACIESSTIHEMEMVDDLLVKEMD
jgi:heme-degrading monooxygenase HmoA